MSIKKNTIVTDQAPAAIGTYSQGIEHNGVYYFSGQIGLDPATNQLVEGLQQQAQQILRNIDGLLDACGLTRQQILKTTVFLTDLGQFSQVNELYQSYFESPYPARSCVEVSRLPKDAVIEIEVIACKTVTALHLDEIARG